MNELLQSFQGLLASGLGPQLGAWAYTAIKTVVLIFCIIAPLMGAVAYLTLWERKFIGWIQIRLGPNRVGPLGLFQPIADGLKALVKELIIPAQSNKFLFLLAPVLALGPALAAWAVIPFAPEVVLADVNAGILYLMAMTSMGVYGVIIAGWASNSKYAFLGAMRSAAQIVAYEIAMGFALVCVLLVSHSLNLSDIVNGQSKGMFAEQGLNFLSWNWLPLLPMLLVYFISGVAETNRAPFDVVEGESEIVAGHMIEYSGMGFATFFLAEYANMLLIATLTAIMFFGGWASPFAFAPFTWLPPIVWLLVKIFVIVSMFLWLRATFPRYRYDQIMRLGWKVFIPITIVWLVLISAWMQTPWNIW